MAVTRLERNRPRNGSNFFRKSPLRVSPEALDANLLPKQRKPVPHAFVLDAISTLSPYTRPMFGCLAIYVREKIVLILRDKPKNTADNGVWLATTQEHHQSLRREFPVGLLFTARVVPLTMFF